MGSTEIRRLDLEIFKKFFIKGLFMDLSNRHYSKQSHMLVNAQICTY